MRFLKYIIYVALSILSLTAIAQDVQFTQFNAAPLYVNPALTGGTITTRAAVHYRNQWTGIGNGYNTIMASFDHQGYGNSLAWGAMVMQDRQGQTGPQSTEVQGSLAYSWAIGDYWQVRAGMQGGVVSKGFDYNSLQFVEQFNNNGLISTGNSENFGNENIIYPELAVGGLVYSKNVWFGAAAHHLTRSRQGFYTDAFNSIPMRYTVHAGMKLSLGGGSFNNPIDPDKDAYIAPVMQYRMQGLYDQLDIGVYWNYTPIVIGVWYRGLPLIKSYEGLNNNDAIAVLVGLSLGNGLSLGYSYDATVSTFSNSRTGGAHEISLTYQWAMGDRAKRAKSGIRRGVKFDVPCPRI